MRNLKPPLYVFALLPILAGCSDPVDPADREPTELRFEANQISGFVGDSIEVFVVVTDSRGRPAPAVNVQWLTYQKMPVLNKAASDVYARHWERSLDPEVTPTGPDGRARAVLVPPTKGVHEIVATADTLTAIVTIITEFPAAPTRLIWHQATPVPRWWWRAASATVTDRVYLVGETGDPVFAITRPPATLVFDPASERWVDVAAVPMAPTYEPGLATGLNDRVHFLHGTRHFVYAPASNTWGERSPAPLNARFGVFLAAAGKLYLATPSGAMLAYDPETDTWSAKAPMPAPGSVAAGAVLDGRIYIAGTSSFTTFDPATDTWTSLAPMPFPRDGFAAAAAGGYVCVFGGGRTLGLSGWGFTETYCYDPASNVWTLEAPMPYVPVDGVSAVSHGGSAYAFGGRIWDWRYFRRTSAAARLTLR